MKYYLGLNSEIDLNKDVVSKFSGVGMIRGENLCINKMQYFTIPNFCSYVTDYLNYVAKLFKDKPVWYRTADLVPHQINILEGCDKKIEEQQYLIGNRGLRRNLTFLKTYLCELEAFKKAYDDNNNLGLLIPFISNVDELKQVKEILKSINYDGKLGIMIEIPSSVIMLDDFNNLGVDYFTIGLNDLTTMILGAHRDIPIYSMNDESVHRVIDYLVNKIHSFGKEVTAAGYLNPQILEYLKATDIDNINIHYNEIPQFFKVQNPDEYTKQYARVKGRYREVKNGKN